MNATEKNMQVEVTTTFGDLFEAISELENHAFVFNEEYYQKEKIEIKDDVGIWTSVKALISKKSKTKKIHFSDGSVVEGADKHKLIIQDLHERTLEDMRVNHAVIKKTSVGGTVVKVVSIESSDVECTVFDLALSSKKHLYQTSNGFIHHNTTLARIVAMASKCTNLGADGNPCSVCEYCLDIINDDFSLDNYFYNAADITIDQMRHLDEICHTTSLMAKTKVVFIDEFQRLQIKSKAHDFLLSLIERDNPDVIFILGSMNDATVSKAIKRRATKYILNPVEFGDIAQYLVRIAEAEKVELNAAKMETLMQISSSSAGSVGIATSFLERCIYGNIWNIDELHEHLGIVKDENVRSIVNSMLTGDVSFLSGIRIGEDLLEKVRRITTAVYKNALGIELSYFEIPLVKGMGKYDVVKIKQTLDNLYALEYYAYVTYEFIQYTFLKCAVENKGTMKTPQAEKWLDSKSLSQNNVPADTENGLKKRRRKL